MALSYSAAPANADRRQGLRVPQARPVKIFHPAGNRYIPGQTLDLSPTGLRLTLPASAPVTVGAMLQIHVASGASAGLASKRSMVPAKVVWVDRAGGHVQAGIQYTAGLAGAATSAA